MAASYFFYDLETSGFNPRDQRIMQFAGQRTDMDLQPIGEPVNVLISLTAEIAPDPDAIMVTGITPQSTQADGITEAEFLTYFYQEVVQPDTCFLGYNTVRFDDEFMRFLHYRNFYDPYEWQWANGCSRWDLLDAVRMTRALRPEGIEWPFTPEGKPTNRLELLTKLNKIDHFAAHDALSDVHATIAVAKLLHSKQPKIFDFLYEHRGKKQVQDVVNAGQPFVYSTGRYPSEYQKTAVVEKIAEQPQGRGAYVYDLRCDPSEFLAMNPQQLIDRWRWNRDEDAPLRLPIKLMQYNHCPAVAPLGVMNEASWKRIQTDLETIKKHRKMLHGDPTFANRVLQAVELMDREQEKRFAKDADVDAQIYEGFLGNSDKQALRAVRVAPAAEIMNFADKLRDERLKQLLPRYKARNHPDSLNDDERREWEDFRRERLLGETSGRPQSRLATFFNRLQELANDVDTTPERRYLLEELQLYGQSIMPLSDDEDQS